MPVMDGLEATRIIRTQPPFSTDARLRATPIIGMAANALLDRQMLVEYRSKGFDDILKKPPSLARLRALLRGWTRWQHALEGPTMAPVWGPYPLRQYRGPRSRL
jgi:CheY-like chemotaxis protein